MRVDTIIIGQGLCGTWLSWWLRKAGQEIIVIDEGKTITSSRIASGVINPVTGRVLAKTWMAEELLPFALETYQAIGNELGISCVHTVDILHCFPTAQMRDAFEKRLPELTEFLSIPANLQQWREIMHVPYGVGVIHPALLIDLHHLLDKWQQHLKIHGQFIEDRFDLAWLSFAGGKVGYRDLYADRIIFCDGIAGMELPFFNRLPFSPNKGEALLIETDGLPPSHIYKKGLSVVPFPHFNRLADNRLFWVGSTYENRYADVEPTKAFRNKAEQQLRDWFRFPFKVLDHWAAIRPATVERRPFAGMHPHHPQIGILNGTGTKGCSLAPWFARQLADQVVHGTPIQPEAAVTRFSRVLSA